MNYTQDQKDEPLTVTLPAWRWRMICYALDLHIEDRNSAGYPDVARRYQSTRDHLRAELSIEGTGNLPVHTDWRK